MNISFISSVLLIDTAMFEDWKWKTVGETRVVNNITAFKGFHRVSCVIGEKHVHGQQRRGEKTRLQRVLCSCQRHWQNFTFRASSSLALYTVGL